MEIITQLGTSLVDLAVYCGGVIVVLFLVYAGFLYATSGGEPQRVAQARTALFMSLMGLLIMGLAFIIPRILSDTVIRPAGGTEVATLQGVDCDEALRAHMVHQRAVKDQSSMHQLVMQLRNRYDECNVDIWPAEISHAMNAMPSATWNTGTESAIISAIGADAGECASSAPGTLNVPLGLRVEDNESLHGNNKLFGGIGDYVLSLAPTKDSKGNIVVWFNPDGGLPWDGALCWVYHDRYAMWVSGQPG